jgi:hypothetical protein
LRVIFPRDRELHAVLGEGAERVVLGLLARERFREQVRGRAKLEHDPGLADLAHQPPVVGGEDPVPDDARRHYLKRAPRSVKEV